MNLEELLSVLMDVEAHAVIGEVADAPAWASVVEACGWTQDELNAEVDKRWDRIDFLRHCTITRGRS